MDKEVYQKYLAQQIMLASPAKLVSMLYERAITLLHQTINAIEAGDIEQRWRTNAKATEVIYHLWDTLDRERGGEIAENLNRLYGFMMMRLTMVDVENDAQAARDVIGLLEPLQRSWHEVSERAEQKTESDDISDNLTPSKITISA
ncbi:MAG: flagellar export chaperone FliS [Alphaproteobacteria bacterium]|nr:flagellar export chaperone FliS [Alphaproteobacteria bacterium]